MAELKRMEEELPTTELASYAIPSKHSYGPKLRKSQERETLDRAAEVPEFMLLFSEPEMELPLRRKTQPGIIRKPLFPRVSYSVISVGPRSSPYIDGVYPDFKGLAH